MLGSLQQRCFKTKFQILLATPCFFWLWPEGVAEDTLSGCPVWEDPPVLDTPGGQLVPSGAPILLLVEEDVPVPHWGAGMGVGVLPSRLGGGQADSPVFCPACWSSCSCTFSPW